MKKNNNSKKSNRNNNDIQSFPDGGMPPLYIVNNKNIPIPTIFKLGDQNNNDALKFLDMMYASVPSGTNK